MIYLLEHFVHEIEFILLVIFVVLYKEVIKLSSVLFDILNHKLSQDCRTIWELTDQKCNVCKVIFPSLGKGFACAIFLHNCVIQLHSESNIFFLIICHEFEVSSQNLLGFVFFRQNRKFFKSGLFVIFDIFF